VDLLLDAPLRSLALYGAVPLLAVACLVMGLLHRGRCPRWLLAIGALASVYLIAAVWVTMVHLQTTPSGSPWLLLVWTGFSLLAIGVMVWALLAAWRGRRRRRLWALVGLTMLLPVTAGALFIVVSIYDTALSGAYHETRVWGEAWYHGRLYRCTPDDTVSVDWDKGDNMPAPKGFRAVGKARDVYDVWDGLRHRTAVEPGGDSTTAFAIAGRSKEIWVPSVAFNGFEVYAVYYSYERVARFAIYRPPPQPRTQPHPAPTRSTPRLPITRRTQRARRV
jgi:hypothetical protein